jgi:hypothetical protein
MNRSVASTETFVRRVYIGAAIYGFIGASTLYLTDAPDPHRLLYFAFAGIALVFQGVFLVIAHNPLKYAAFIPLTVFEKMSFGVPAIAFWSQGQAADDMALGGAVDLLLMVLFALCWLKIRRTEHV